MSLLENYINGEFAASSGKSSVDVICPKDGTVLAKVPLSTSSDVDVAVQHGLKAFEAWKSLTIKQRAAVMFKFHHLVEEHARELAEIIVKENGKNITEALADVAKGNETVEWATSLPQLAKGNILEVSRGISCQEVRNPVGVVAAIVPFNFPGMAVAHSASMFFVDK